MGAIAPALAFDDALYPDLSGQWLRINLHKGGQFTFDQTKAWGLGQEAPLTPEYQAVLDASIADQENGGQGNWYSGARCLPPGMPATMNAYNSLEFIVLPEVTYILNEHNLPIKRRIYTDGRDWPKDIDPTFQGYSIGRWLDNDGDGRLDTLEVETRSFKGPRALDPTGIPVHVDNQSIVKERIHLDKADPKRARRRSDLVRPRADAAVDGAQDLQPQPGPRTWVWLEENCPAQTRLIQIGSELYFKGADDKLLPTRKDQPPPDLKYFDQTRR